MIRFMIELHTLQECYCNMKHNIKKISLFSAYFIALLFLLLITKESLHWFDGLTLSVDDGEKIQVDLPVSGVSQGGLVKYRLEGALNIGWLAPKIYTFIPDDRLLGLKVNNEHIDLNQYDSRSLSDYNNGVEIDLNKTLKSGRNTISIEFIDTGGLMGIKIIPINKNIYKSIGLIVVWFIYLFAVCGMAHRSNASKYLYFIILVGLFTMAFWDNSLKSVDQKWFDGHQLDSEALVIGRLARTELNGLWDSEGRLGTYSVSAKKTKAYTNEDYVYEKEDRSGIFHPYSSQIGLQGILLSLVDQSLRVVTPLNAMKRKNILHLLVSFLTALTVATIIIFIRNEFGVFVATLTTFFALYSQWLVVFSNNLYWVMFFMYLPMIITLYFYQSVEYSKKKYGLFFLALLISVMMKCASGFEYITTVFIAALCPVIYFSIKRAWSLAKTIINLTVIGLASFLGFVFTFILHVYQQSIGDGLAFGDALIIRFSHSAKRLHAKTEGLSNDMWVRGGEASIWDVLSKYWNGEIFDFGYLLGNYSITPINFSVILIFILILSPLVLVSEDFIPTIAKKRRQFVALLVVVWTSFLGALSWHVLAKVHSYVHGHMNHVLWNIPFIFFAAAYFGVILRCLYLDYAQKAWGYIGWKKMVYSILVVVGFTIIISLVSAMRYDAKFDKILRDSEELNFSNENPLNAFIIENKVVFFSRQCNAQSKYDVQLNVNYIANGKSSKLIRSGILKPISSPLLSSYKDLCGLEFKFEKITPISFRLNIQGDNFGEAYVVNRSTHNITSYPLTDHNWSKGISRKFSGFFVDNTILNRALLSPGVELEFMESSNRKIISSKVSKNYINITVSGGKLNPVDGYPAKITIRGLNKIL